MGKVVIGIDQSYKRTGVTVLRDKEIEKIFYLEGDGMTHAEFRRKIRCEMNMILADIVTKIRIHNVKMIMERIRLMSNGNLSQTYIQTTAALCGTLIEVGEAHKIPVYSVDTRAWKSAIVGTSKSKENKYGFDPKKYPTILYMSERGLLRHIIEPYSGRATKGIITVRDGNERYRARVIDDMADSYCIALYGFLPSEKQKLKLENF